MSNIFNHPHPFYDDSKTVLLRMLIIGGFIASVTAFIVANGVLSGLIGWLSPTAIGGFIIAYWTIKLNRKRKNKAVN